MKRRNFVTSALAGLGLVAVPAVVQAATKPKRWKLVHPEDGCPPPLVEGFPEILVGDDPTKAIEPWVGGCPVNLGTSDFECVGQLKLHTSRLKGAGIYLVAVFQPYRFSRSYVERMVDEGQRRQRVYCTPEWIAQLWKREVQEEYLGSIILVEME